MNNACRANLVPTGSIRQPDSENDSNFPPGPPMTLGNMRRQGVQHLIAYCLNDACRHQAIIDVSKYPQSAVVCGPHQMRQVRSARVGRRAAELERTAAGREPDRQAVAVSRRAQKLNLVHYLIERGAWGNHGLASVPRRCRKRASPR
jgi:transposase